MPHSDQKSKKSAAGIGTIRKKTVNRKGKEYTFWEARYTEGYDPGTGKQIQRYITGKTQKEVAQKLKAATAAIDAGTYTAPCKMTVGEWLDIWAAEYLGAVKPLTERTYTEQIKTHIKPALGAVKLEALNTHMIQYFYNSLTNGSAANLSPKTVKNVHGVFHKALQQAVANGYIHQNPGNACILPKIQKPEIKPLEPKQIAMMLQASETDDYCNLFTVALFTGMRQGELLGLSWDCIDFSSGIITVKQQLQYKDGCYFLSTPKSGKPRTILPAAIVMDALRHEQEKQAQAQKEVGSLWSNPFHLVFTDVCGKNLSAEPL